MNLPGCARTTAPVALGALLLGACAGRQTPPPPRPLTVADWFPLRAGAAWSYDTQTGIGGDTVLASLRVERAQAPRYTVRSGARTETYEVREDGVLREGEYILRAPLRPGATWEGNAGGRFEVRGTHLQRTVGGQAYTDVVEVVRTGSRVGITTTTWYAPRVGVIEVLASTESSRGAVLSVRSTLRGYTLGEPEAEGPQ